MGDHGILGGGSAGIVHFMAILVIFFTALFGVILAGRALYHLAQKWDEVAVNEGIKTAGRRAEFKELQRKADMMDRATESRPVGDMK